MTQRIALRESVLAALGNSYTLVQEDLGADARLSKKGMTFETESWEIQGVGHLCIMRMNALPEAPVVRTQSKEALKCSF